MCASRAHESRRLIRRTPLMRHPLFAAETGLDIHVKHENHNPTGAFKVRGGLNLIASLSSDERAPRRHHRQHGQPRPVDRVRVAASGRLLHRRRARREQPRQERGDARIRRDAWSKRDRISTRRANGSSAKRTSRGLRYVHSANEPALIAGVGTYALEIFEDAPGSRRDSRADRRRQRRLRLLHRANRSAEERRASSACRPSKPTPLRARGAVPSACRWTRSARSPKALRPAIRSI